MSTSTCYTDTGWCGIVPIDPDKTSVPASWEEPWKSATPSTTNAQDKPKQTGATHTGNNDKAPQTDDKGQPEQTQNAKPGETFSKHLSSTALATATPITHASATARYTDSDVIGTVAPSAAAANVSSGSGGVSKGAAAGIAIATAIIGGAIAFLVAFILFKRRRRASGHGHSPSATAFISTMKGEYPAYMQVSQTGPPPIAAAAQPPSKRSLDLSNLSHSSEFLAGVLSPGADEQTVKNRVTTLFSQIQQHVDDFYRDVHATLTPSMEKDLRRFGDASMNLAEELEHSSMPTIAIKHALTGYILSIVAPEADQQSTLFPVEVAGLRQNERSIESPDDQAAYILYKRLAAYLHAPQESSLQSRQSDIREAAEHFALTFFPWANPVYADRDKDENLVDVINTALDLSLWLFGQPYLYEWVWEEVGGRGTVIAPGLMRMTDERGRILERPIRVVDAVVAAE